MRVSSASFWIRGAALLTTAVLVVKPAAQAGTSCTCQDIPGLVNALNMDGAVRIVLEIEGEALISAFPNANTDYVPASDNPKGLTLLDTLGDYMREAARSVDNKNRVRSPACQATYTPLQTHGQTSLLRVIGELQAEYASADEDILRRLGAMPASCRPDGWFGVIAVVDIEQSSVAMKIPAKKLEGDPDQGGEESADTQTTRTGTIWLDGRSPYPSSSWMAEEESTKTTEHRNSMWCRSDRKGPKVSRVSTTHEVLKLSGADSRTLVGFSLEEDGHDVTISLSMPEIAMSGEYSKTNELSGGCNEKPQPDEKTSLRDTLSGEDVSVHGTVSSGASLRISGSGEVDLGAPVNFGVKDAVTRTHTARFGYQLYKFR